MDSIRGHPQSSRPELSTPNVKKSPPLNSQRDSSLRQTKALLAVGFGGLLFLMCVLGASSVSFLYQIEIRHEALRQEYLERNRALDKLRANIYISGTYFRDFAFDESDAAAASDRGHFLIAKSDVLSSLAEYRHVASPAEARRLQEFWGELKSYLDTLTQALSWNVRERRERANLFIQQQLLPRRTTIISLSDRLQQFSERQLEVNSQGVSDMFSSFRTRLLALTLLTLGIGAALAMTTIWRLLSLERIAEARYLEIVSAREELKQLSSELLQAQETERRRLSRELHDEVGQALSATMLGVGNLRSLLKKDGLSDAAARQLTLIEDMTGHSARVIRNLSLLLRPTMLDDLGLIAALKWLGREISRNGALQVEVATEDSPDDLTEEHRTCVYRVVQEAIRNASRHSGGHHARVTVETDGRWLHVAVQDDGRGFRPEFEKGMGILGMEERVKRLGGSLHIGPGAGRGTTLSFDLPLPPSDITVGPVQETSPFRTA